MLHWKVFIEKCGQSFVKNYTFRNKLPLTDLLLFSVVKQKSSELLAKNIEQTNKEVFPFGAAFGIKLCNDLYTNILMREKSVLGMRPPDGGWIKTNLHFTKEQWDYCRPNLIRVALLHLPEWELIIGVPVPGFLHVNADRTWVYVNCWGNRLTFVWKTVEVQRVSTSEFLWHYTLSTTTGRPYRTSTNGFCFLSGQKKHSYINRYSRYQRVCSKARMLPGLQLRTNPQF